MSDILIRGIDMPKGGYRTVEIGIDADGHPMAIGDDKNVYDVIPILLHGTFAAASEKEVLKRITPAEDVSNLMDEYITRKAAKKTMCCMCEGGAKLVCGTLNDCCTTMRIFDSIPAADVRPVVHGKWVKAEYEEDDWPFPEDMFYLCSNCNTRHGFVGEQPNFCPNCGADMRAKEGE